MVCRRIQRILRHANVSTTATYYIKTAADDVKHAMEKLENNILQSKSQTKHIFDCGCAVSVLSVVTLDQVR
jgi:hypothetical protein